MNHHYLITVKLLLVFFMVKGGHSIGANWGTQASHPLHPTTVVRLLKDNGIQKVKLFDAEARVMNALSGSGIEVMVGIPNDMLSSLANSATAAERWVERNISAYLASNSVDIRYVAVGNEPFLSTFNGTYLSTTFPALSNIQAAINKAGLGSRIKVTIPLNAEVYQSSTQQPSTGDFRPDIQDQMVQIVNFFSLNGAPFTVNIYPFLSLYNDPNFPVEYAFFDGLASPIDDNGRTYTNVFDANYDTLVWALQRNGVGNLTIIVGEIGWPTDGNRNGNIANAQRFNQGYMSHVNRGTPMRPGPIDTYLFSLLDEDDKSIQPGYFERHWGIFNYDGTPKYNLSLGSNSGGLVPATNVHYFPRRWCVLSSPELVQDPQVALSVSYACDRADCTSLGYGSSCADLDAQGNISYTFNSYYQQNNQLESACRFPNLSVITTVDPSVGNCRFKIMIETGDLVSGGYLLKSVNMVLIFATLLSLYVVL